MPPARGRTRRELGLPGELKTARLRGRGHGVLAVAALSIISYYLSYISSTLSPPQSGATLASAPLARPPTREQTAPPFPTARGNLGVLLDAKARQLDEDGASDPAALARIYTEAADMATFGYGAESNTVLRCRQRAAELAGN